MGRPDVSADVIVGFDHHSDEFNLNEREVNADLRSRCPVAWNEKYGGFWYVSSYDAVEQVARDGDTFAHKYEPNAADGVNYQGEMGVPRPEGQPPLGIGEVDGPYHLALRRALTPFFSIGRHREDAAVHGAVGALVPRPADRRRPDGPRARLRQSRPGHPHHEVDGSALRQLAALRQPLPLGDGRLRRRRVQQGDRRSPRDDRRPAEVRGDPAGRSRATT